MKRQPATIVTVRLVLAGTLLTLPVRGQEADPAPLAGHSYHGEAFNEGPRQQAYLMGGCGDVEFPVTTDQERVQAFFNQGVGQLHGFWYFEAERSFRQVAMFDPHCAMAYWGMAMANVDNPDRAAGFIEQAVVRADGVTPRERMWIDSLAAFYEVTPESAARGLATRRKAEPDAKPAKRKFKASKKDRSAALAKAYEAIAQRYADDVEAKAFYVNRVWLNRRAGLPTENYDRMEDLLEQIFAAHPNHPAHHYRIHLWDRKDAARALVSAAVSGQVSPAVAHQWHMSGHIFARLHRHGDAVWQQQASARVDHAHMMRDRVMPYQIHNFGHNNEWLCRSLSHVGRVQDALSLAKNMVELPRHPEKNQIGKRSSIAGYGRTKLLETCRKFLLLDDLRELDDRGYFGGDDGAAADLAAAYLLMGDLERGRRYMARAKAAQKPAVAPAADRAKKPAGGAVVKATAGGKAGPAGAGKPAGASRRAAKAPAVPQRIQQLDGLLALAEGDTGKAAGLLKKLTLAKIYQADVRLAQGDPAAARKLIDAEAKANPNRAEVMARQVWIQAAAGDHAAARGVFDDLRRVAGRGDLDVPLFARLRPLAERFGYPTDWRLPAPPATDVGVRPDLAELGPFRWRPSPAPDWELPSSGADPIGLRKNYAGKPVLVIFYLGFGCLHCVEQLQAFHPMTGKFRAAGIEIVAVGTDTLAGMRKSLAEMAATDRFAFPLVADPTMAVFKQWRAFDEFENQPLHGTFLVDADGMVRWQDISYQPFEQPQWLLAECRRLLAQPRRRSR